MDEPSRQPLVLEKVLRLREQAADALDRHAVPVYLFLTERFDSTTDIRSDYLVQFLFRSYYRLDKAGLTDEFKEAYFELLQGQRAGPRPEPYPAQLLRQLCEELARYDTKKGRKSLQFSFATKLLATIDPEQPLYDSFVAHLFGFRRPDDLKGHSKRLKKLLRFYELLRRTSRLITEQPWFGSVNATFEDKHEGWQKVPPMKRVDLILWATGKAVKRVSEAGEGGGRHDCLGFPVSAVLRWMGRSGWAFAEAKEALAKLCPGCKEGTIRAYLRAGAKGERGEPAALTAAQIQQLEAAAGKGGEQ
jgi:hypothetical protein